MGPGSINCRSALAREGPDTVTSASLKRSASFETPVGNFSYTRIPQFNFSGVERVAEGNSIYLLASPTKALADFIVASKVELPPAALMNFLRIEEESLSQISWPLLKEIAENYRSIRLRKFVKALRKSGVPG